MVPGQELGRTAGLPVPGDVAPPLLGRVGGLVLVQGRDVVEHEATTLAVLQDAAFAPDALGDQDPLDAGGPHHPRGMELEELHVDELRSGVVGQSVAVAGVLPGVAGDLVRLADAPGGHDHRAGPEDGEAPSLPVVAQGARHPVAILQEGGDGDLHVDVQALVDAMVLEGADHLQAGTVPHVGQPRVGVAAEVPLQDLPVGGPVHEGAPRLQLPDPVRRLPGVELRHPPVVEVSAASHGVGEVDPPVVALVDVGQGGSDAALRHHRMRLAQQRLADQPDPGVLGGLDGGPEARPSRADDQHVVLHRPVLGHQKILQSVQTPMESIRT